MALSIKGLDGKTRSNVFFCGSCKAGAIIGRCGIDGCRSTTYSCDNEIHGGLLITTCGHSHPETEGAAE